MTGRRDLGIVRVMTPDPLREQLDRASFTPRGTRKPHWEAAAREFAEPAWAAVAAALADSNDDGAAEAVECFASPPQVLPRLPVAAWLAGFTALRPRMQAQRMPVLKALALLLQDEPDIEVALPLLLAGCSDAGAVCGVGSRSMNWLARQPWGPAAAVACLLQDDLHVLHAGAFACLGHVRELPTAARGALWLAVWRDPWQIGSTWPTLARLGEPAAIACILADAMPVSVAELPPRPAVTRALVRIVEGEDPWLTAYTRRTAEEWRGRPPEKFLARAVELLPFVALRCGELDAARAVLASRWAALPGGAVAWALLGGVEAAPALVEQLSADDDAPAMALAALGPRAADVADAAQARLHGFVAVIVEAALRPSPEALDRLISVVDADLAPPIPLP